MHSKDMLRVWLKSKRLAMDKAILAKKSQNICKRLFDFLNLEQIKNINCYQSIESLNEVDTANFITALQKYPRVNLVLQAQQENVEELSFDLIIVPTLGFDSLGNRIGWGGGFYDKFLATQPNALKVGLCFEAMKIKTTFPEPHDVKLDAIITELKAYRF
jgi:5-formyltetrahydrofolate cyclo-ligase